MTSIKKSVLPRTRAQQLDQEWHMKDEYAEAEFPYLNVLLCSAKDDDGVYRNPCTLNFFVEVGKLKVKLTDKHSSQIGWATLQGFENAFHQVDRLLESGKVDWRPYKPFAK